MKSYLEKCKLILMTEKGLEKSRKINKGFDPITKETVLEWDGGDEGIDYEAESQWRWIHENGQKLGNNNTYLVQHLNEFIDAFLYDASDSVNFMEVAVTNRLAFPVIEAFLEEYKLNVERLKKIIPKFRLASAHAEIVDFPYNKVSLLKQQTSDAEKHALKLLN